MVDVASPGPVCVYRNGAIITLSHSVGEKNMHNSAFALFFQMVFHLPTSVYTSIPQSRGRKTIKGDLTQNSPFSLCSSPYSMSLTYSGNLSVGIGSMSATGKAKRVGGVSFSCVNVLGYQYPIFT